MTEEYKKCQVCNGRGYLDDTEPEEYMTPMGNQAIRFRPTKMPCPNNRCKDGIILPDEK